MNAIPTLPLPGATDFIGRLEKRILRDIHDGTEEWSDCVRALTQWERENLLDNPTEDLLQHHKLLTESLLHLGKLLRTTTASPEFPDKALAGTVAAGVNILEDKLLIWHVPMAQEDADRVLREVGLL